MRICEENLCGVDMGGPICRGMLNPTPSGPVCSRCGAGGGPTVPQPWVMGERDADRLTEDRSSTGLVVGDVITVTHGPETFTPIKYHTFTIGPFTANTHVLPCETAADAYRRAMSELRKLMEAEFEARCRGYLERVKATREIREAMRVRSEG